MSRKHRIGIVGHDDQLKMFCEKSLGLIGNLAFYENLDAILEPLNDNILLFIIKEPHADQTAALARCIKVNPDLPVIVVGADFSPNQAVELIQCGAKDYLCLPTKPVEIRLKVDRHLYKRRGPVFTDSLLMPFEPTSGRVPLPYMGPNRRLCYRANVIPDTSRCIKFMVDAKTYFMEIVEISVATEKQAGGLLLRPAIKPTLLEADNTDTEVQLKPFRMQEKNRSYKEPETLPLPWKDLKDGKELECYILLGGLAERPIPARIKVIFTKRHKRKNLQSRIAIQYFSKNVQDNSALNQFWMQCQRAEHILP